jgi:parallel beta-helix repeat protein
LADVRIAGAICSGPTLGGSSSVQQYGIYASQVSGLVIDGCTLTDNLGYGAYLNAVENVTVTACDVYSNETGSNGIAVVGSSSQDSQYVFIRNCNGAQYGSWGDVVSVTGTVQNVEVTNCAGYNDVAAPLRTTPPSSSPFSGTTYGYYGPVTAYGAGSSELAVSIASESTGLGNGAFPLGPGENLAYAIGLGGHTWTTFLMVGQ